MNWESRKKAWWLTVILLGTAHARAATIWDGPVITFTRPSGADWIDPTYQDHLTDNVWLTRADIKGLFNIRAESSYVSTSPAGTEWADGSTTNLLGLIFFAWQDWNGSNPPGMIGRDAVLHLITDDIYLDIKFTSWDVRTGGGFSYERATAIPEPTTAGLTLLGLAGLLLCRQRFRAAKNFNCQQKTHNNRVGRGGGI